MDTSERPAMSDTPRTDAGIPDLTFRPYTLEWQRAQQFARQLERELNEAQHRIRTLIEERDSARIQADHKWELREEFEALLGTSDVATGVERIKEAKRGAARYEVVRKMNAVVFKNLFWRCIEMNLRFDDEVDKLSERRKIRMHLNAKKEEKP